MRADAPACDRPRTGCTRGTKRYEQARARSSTGSAEIHPTYVFAYRGERVGRMHHTAWKRARVAASLAHLRVYDLKHTYGRRLRAAGDSLETRKVLLGHRNGEVTTHYPAPEIAELITASERVCEDTS